jgi:hypothetical protein
MPADAHRLLALGDFQFRNTGLFQQLDQLLYFANVHPRTPSKILRSKADGEARAGRFQRELVTDRAKSDDAAGCDIGQIRAMPELLASEYVAQVNFDERYGNGEKGVAQRDAGVGKRAGIDDYEGDPVALGG